MQSSDGILTYPMEFSVENGMLHFYCGCPAGALGKWCKHKQRIVSGDVTAVLGTIDSSDTEEMLAWVNKSEFPRLLGEMRSAEEELRVVKKKMDSVKKALENAAKKGMKV